PATQRKRNGRADTVADKHDEKPPPKSKEKAAANAQDSTRQEQNIAQREEKWVTDPGPSAEVHDALVESLNGVDERKATPQQDNQNKRAEKRYQPEANRAPKLRHREILRASDAARKYASLVLLFNFHLLVVSFRQNGKR